MKFPKTLALAVAVSTAGCSDLLEPRQDDGPDAVSSPRFSMTWASQPLVDGLLRDPVTGELEPAYAQDGVTYLTDAESGAFVGYLLTHSENGWVYYGFEQSTSISDNTYGYNAIGWGKARGLQDLARGDRLNATLLDCSGAPAASVHLDYLNEDRQSGLYHSRVQGGKQGTVVDYASGMDWNLYVASPHWPAWPVTNPQRIDTNDYGPGTSADPNYPWIYEVTYEWAVAQSLFTDGCAGDVLLSPVNAPPKPAFSGTAGVTPQSTLHLALTADPEGGTELQAHQNVTFTLTLTNPGASPLTGLVARIPLDGDLAGVVPGPGGAYDEASHAVTWAGVSLTPGEVRDLTVTASFEPMGPAAVVLTRGFVGGDQIPVDARSGTLVHEISDVDGDGVGDPFDNCPEWPNADRNGIGDACEGTP